ncbi:hypothetical protein [Streptomyces pseudovenezuelae]|uniref:Uncharacterized protein n=1 Tax=Streptomyces pseudovenezuelae TaxID=67350 RepID=A0ABZ1XB19_9ACTN|nr:hypothetical protein [Streptomyces pseudovenezuelae]
MAVHGVHMVVADEIGEAGVVAAEARAARRGQCRRRRPQRESRAEQARAAQESASRHALRVEVGGGDGRVGPGGQLLLGHGDPRKGVSES